MPLFTALPPSQHTDLQTDRLLADRKAMDVNDVAFLEEV